MSLDPELNRAKRLSELWLFVAKDCSTKVSRSVLYLRPEVCIFFPYFFGARQQPNLFLGQPGRGSFLSDAWWYTYAREMADL